MPKIVHCPACGKEIASNASKCPHCGYSFAVLNAKAGCLTFLILGGGFILFIMLISAFNH